MRAVARLAAVALAVLGAAVATLPVGPAQGALFEFRTTLLGTNEVPPNASPATGFADVLLDDAANSLVVSLTFSGLLAPAAAAHIHCCVLPGANAPVRLPFSTADGFPFQSTAGSFLHTYNLAASLTGISVASFIQGLEAGQAYVNIHDSPFPGGEIRGFLVAVPEPASMALLGTGIVGLLLLRRRRA